MPAGLPKIPLNIPPSCLPALEIVEIGALTAVASLVLALKRQPALRAICAVLQAALCPGVCPALNPLAFMASWELATTG